MPSRSLLSRSAGLGRHSPSSRAVVFVAMAIAVLLLGGGFAYFKSRSLNIPTDPLSLCPTDRPPTQIVAILLDPSDRLGEPQRIRVRDVLSRVRDDVPKFGLIEVYRLDPLAFSVPQAVLHLCNPGTGKDLNRIYQNPDLAMKRWQTFADTLMTVIDSQISAGQQATSPIFEAVQAIGVRTFSQSTFDKLSKRLVVVSDLLQNVPGKLNMYSGMPPFVTFSKTAYFAEVRADLSGVSVFLIYLNRPTVPVQGPAHVTFWFDYFAEQHARVDSVYQLYGDK